MSAVMRRLVLIIPLMVWAAAEANLMAVQDARQAQIEKGRTAVTQVCTGCHGGGIMRILEVREKSADEWRDTVYKMIGRGAQVLPEEIEPLTMYLASIKRARQAPGNAVDAGADAAGDAAAILSRRCRQCHDVERAATLPAGQNWNTIIDRMVTLGAALTPAERRALIAHLTAGAK